MIKDVNVIWFINVKDLFKYYDRKVRFHVKKFLRPIIYVPETMKIFILEETLKKEHSHLVIVVNKYGDFTGIVILEDIIEELLGEIEWMSLIKTRFLLLRRLVRIFIILMLVRVLKISRKSLTWMMLWFWKIFRL